MMSQIVKNLLLAMIHSEGDHELKGGYFSPDDWSLIVHREQAGGVAPLLYGILSPR